MNMVNKYYITTPIYYVNDKPHIGHAYTTLACDVIARFKKLDGYDVHFLTGTDEFGQKIERSAKKNGKGTQEFVDNLVPSFVNMMKMMDIQYDDFIRTTQRRHTDFVQKMWGIMLDKGDIYLDKYCGWYSIRDEAFYAESELVNGKAPTGADVEWVEEESYFFKLSMWQDKLLEFYDSNPDFIMPESKRNEVISFVKSGLRDLSISRTSTMWGIPVPNNNKHVMYVWLDALFNYISALTNPKDLYSKFWPCDLHIIGKDILRFHAVYWPAFLMSVDLPLPKKIFAHGWWTNNGEKISKSLGNTIDPIDLINKFGVDYVRYYMMREISFGNDGNYMEENFISRVNSELANNIGNLSQRVLSFVYKNCDGKIPQYGDFQTVDVELFDDMYNVINLMKDAIDEQAINCAIGVVFDLGKKANLYVDKQAPWQLKKEDIVRMNTVLYVLCECIRIIALLLQPFVPKSAKILLDNLGLVNEVNGVKFICCNKDFTIKVGTSIPEPIIVFNRL